jgi:hypothetical protein
MRGSGSDDPGARYRPLFGVFTNGLYRTLLMKSSGGFLLIMLAKIALKSLSSLKLSPFTDRYQRPLAIDLDGDVLGQTAHQSPRRFLPMNRSAVGSFQPPSPKKLYSLVIIALQSDQRSKDSKRSRVCVVQKFGRSKKRRCH